MAKGVAQVEQGPGAGRFTLVLGHDTRLGLYGTGDGGFAGLGIASQQGRAIGFAPCEERRVAQQAVLHHFGVTGTDFTGGQGIQRIWIGQR